MLAALKISERHPASLALALCVCVCVLVAGFGLQLSCPCLAGTAVQPLPERPTRQKAIAVGALTLHAVTKDGLQAKGLEW